MMWGEYGYSRIDLAIYARRAVTLSSAVILSHTV
jgi:hypothetical protein